MELRVRALCNTAINQFNVPAANKQGATELDSNSSKESELKFIRVYARFLLQLTYVCN